MPNKLDSAISITHLKQGIESIDIPRILSQQGGEAIYPLPHIRALEVHSKLNLAALLFANMTGGDNLKNRATCTREGRKQLFAVLQSARGSSGFWKVHGEKERSATFNRIAVEKTTGKRHTRQRVEKTQNLARACEPHAFGFPASELDGLPATVVTLLEKLSSLGSSGILADHQLQAQLQEHHLKGSQSQLTISDIARKAFLYSCGPECKSVLNLTLHFMEGHAKNAPISRLPLITILNTKHYLTDIPTCLPFHLELNFFNKENRVLHYPVRAFYVDGMNLMGYNLCSGVDNIYKKLYTSIPGNVEFHPKHIVYSKKQHLFLVVYEFSGYTNEVVLYWENTNSQLANSKANTVKGRDAVFIGPNENQFAILDDDETSLALYVLPGGASKEAGEKNLLLEEDQWVETNAGALRGPMQFMFESKIDRIFSTPLESTLMFAINGNQIGFAKLVQGFRLSTSDGHYIPTKTEGRKSIKLKMNEIVHQVHWQETLRGYVAGILTTQRVLIVSADLDILASSSAKFDKGLPSFRSLLWVGPALLFSTATAVSVLGWDGVVRTILSISMPYTVLLGALNDRLLLANPTETNPRQKKGVEIRSCLVGLLEPLLIGFSTMQEKFEQKLDLTETLYQITSRFDSLRITPRSLDILARGPPVCGDLALSLSQAGPQFTQVLRGAYAVKALRFSTALSVLKDEFLRSRDYPKCPPTSQLFHRFQQLGHACIKYGQFDSAKETFEVVRDYESMLSLFICHLNPSAMRRLAQKLEEESADPEIRRYCERILRARSTGWTQGIFANFAAESMVPKGPEWGGGNWEIKTPTNLKSIPQWELAAEVMPYMRTDDGTIPAIITDHIGVYLGSIKGRGTVVEVRDDSLVKAFKSAGENMPIGLPNTSAKSMSNEPKRSPDGNTNVDSLMGLETLIKQNVSSSAADEQTKAQEEFKKTMYGATDGSSSDEEEPSRAKKLQIRIRDKPLTSTTVDVNKIKEATKIFKLGEGLGPPMRTKSLTGSQDLGQILSQPPAGGATAATVPTVPSTATDLFGIDTLTQSAPVSQPSPMVAGMGVTAGPIPEDFFQNTIPSLQVAASLPPPGTYLAKLDQTSRQVGSDKVMPNPVGPSVADIGLPDGGVPPPQATQQAISHEFIGLPDGGVPPKASSQPVVSPQLQVQTPQALQASTLSQPIDLNLLVDSGKPPPQTAAPPSAVRPGQVPRGAAASICFKVGLAHLEQNQLPDALSCFNEAFLALAKDNSQGADIKAQATICAQYRIAVTLLQEIARLQKVHGPSALSAKDEMARLSRHLGSLPLLAKHRINCIRTAIKRNMEVQNFAYAKQMLELLLSKAPPGKQDDLRSLVEMCVQRGSANKSIDPLEDPSHFCAGTLSRLSTIGYDVCDLCGAKFSALSTPGCIICGMGSIKRSDAVAGPGPVPSPFG
uniref:Transducin/WD40 repeat-like superfamily protein n=1 Tax=Manihot esculenta TaxID=3983 RepID=A0A2C9UWC3_MANES